MSNTHGWYKDEVNLMVSLEVGPFNFDLGFKKTVWKDLQERAAEIQMRQKQNKLYHTYR